MSTETAQTAQTNTQAATATETQATGQQAIASTETQTNQTQSQPTAPVVPEKYDLKAPENSHLNQAQLDAIAKFSKENKLTAEQAQGLVEREHGAVKAYAENQQKEYDKRISGWADESRADKEIGGDALNKNVELTKRFVAKFFDPSVAKFIDQSGYGNQKEVIRGFLKVIKAANFSEDTFVGPSASASGPKRAADLFYPPKASE